MNSPAWCLFLHGCQEVQIRGYKAFNERTWANTDGLEKMFVDGNRVKK